MVIADKYFEILKNNKEIPFVQCEDQEKFVKALMSECEKRKLKVKAVKKSGFIVVKLITEYNFYVQRYCNNRWNPCAYVETMEEALKIREKQIEKSVYYTEALKNTEYRILDRKNKTYTYYN